ncbi:hypothetical protein BG006_000460 [Podila minutissima]|uniref:F-box domain-containing protein n=1 Tax=Podila minutissima TaxID=64525 RepID=A0A9P5SBC1_9FUNG|nr:hypothetical protein BG006_000460 [Podila minutissima]
MVVDNPLELYEIVCRVGTFIQLYTWDRDDARFYRFAPNDLLSCLRVCRLWHAVLVPLLWTVYSDLEMERRKVPIETIVAHSQHIRFFEYNNNVSRGPLLPSNLRELRLNGVSSFESCADYILANPHLTALDWTLRLEHQMDPLQCLAIQTALESLSQLQRLRLDNWRVYDPVQLNRLIRKTPGLKELALVQMEGLGRLEGCPLIHNVTRLYLQCLWSNMNPGLSDLLRLCPNLQSLTLFNFNDCPMATIIRNLRECCPWLTTIDTMATYLDAHDPVPWEEGDVLMIFEATQHLVHCRVPIEAMSTRICNAILAQAGSLESIHLFIEQENDATFRNANIVLSSCSNLKAFTMSSGTSGWSAKHAPDLLAQPWNLPVLETFELNGFKQRAFEYEDAFYNTFDDSGADNIDAKSIDQGEGVEGIEGETPLDQKNEHMDKKQVFEDKTLIINKAMYLRGNEGNAALLSSRHMHTDYGKYPYQDPELMATLSKQGWNRHRIYSHRWLGHVSSCHANILRRKLFARLRHTPSVPTNIQYLDINVARPPTLTPEVLRDLLIVAEARHPHMTGMEWLKENHITQQLCQQLVLSTLESCTRLKTLRTRKYRVRARGGSSQLDRIFSNNPGLLELTLCDLERFKVLDGSQPYTKITTLQLESGWTDNNKGMLELLRRYDRRCGKLQIRRSHVRGLTEIEHVQLIELFRSLEHYTMLLDDLTLPVCRGLVAHTNSLNSFDLAFKGHTIEGLASLETVLCGCRNLSVLRLSNAFHTWNEVDGAILLRGVWGCVYLQHIEVCGYVLPATDMETGQGEPTSVGTSMPMPQEAGEDMAIRAVARSMVDNRGCQEFFTQPICAGSVSTPALLKSAALIQLNPKLTDLKVTVDGHFGMATKAAVTALKVPVEFADNTDDDMDEIGEEEEEDEEEWRQEKVYTFSDLHLVLETLSNLKSFHLPSNIRSHIKPLVLPIAQLGGCRAYPATYAFCSLRGRLQYSNSRCAHGAPATHCFTSFHQPLRCQWLRGDLYHYRQKSWPPSQIFGPSPWASAPSGTAKTTSNERHVVEEADKGFEIPDTDSDVDIQASATMIPERHPASDRAFFESLAKVGWAYRKEIDPYDTKERPISNSTRATRNKLFERLVHLPHMRDIKLPDTRYFKL